MNTYVRYMANRSVKLLAEYVAVDKIILLDGFSDLTFLDNWQLCDDETDWYSFKGEFFLITVIFDFKSHTILIDEFKSNKEEVSIYNEILNALKKFGKEYKFNSIEPQPTIQGYNLVENNIILD